jgi:hypothetical protein
MEISQIVASEVYKYIIDNKDKFIEVFRMINYCNDVKEDEENHPHNKTKEDLKTGLHRTVKVVIG